MSKSNEFKNKELWAIILGGSTGLGLASAKKLAQHGMNICIVHRNTRSEMSKIEDSFREFDALNVQFVSFNVNAIQKDKMDMVISTLKEKIQEGKVRCLLHSIAKGNLKPMVSSEAATLQKEDFMLTFENMAASLYDWTQALFSNNMFAEDARVLSFTSEGNKKAFPGYAAVSVAKAALEAITRNMALELATYGVRANCIQAGITNTNSQRMIPGSEKMLISAESRNPFKRITQPEDVANVVYLLCKDEAAWINGSVIVVDGGESVA